MEASTEKTKSLNPACPVCGAERTDPASTRCENCGSDLSAIKAIEDFTNSLLLKARADIRDRKYPDAKVRLEVASWMDPQTALTAKLVGIEMLENEHHYSDALAQYEEIKATGMDTSKWGVNIDEKIRKLVEKLEIEQAAKEHYNLALHRSREGFFTEAREELYKASDLAPYIPEIYLLAAKVDLSIGAEAAIYDDLARFRQLCPGDPRGEQMLLELEHRKHAARIQMDQVFFAMSFMLFAIVVIIIIAIIK